MATTQATSRSNTASSEIIEQMQGGWGPVLSGAAVAFLTFITLSSLWLAIAASGADWMATNIEWFEFFTALVAAPIGGAVTGRLTPSSGAGAGAMRGMASWGLVLVVALILGAPTTAALFSGASEQAVQVLTQAGGGEVGLAQSLDAVSSNMWAAFLIFGGGAILAGLAGSGASSS